MSAITIEARKTHLGMSLPSQYALIGVLLIMPTLLIFTLVIAYPLLEAIYLSFFSIYTPTLQGHWVGLENYRTMLSSQEFWKALGTNIVWTVGTLTLQVVLGIAIALLLNLNFYFRSLRSEEHTSEQSLRHLVC